MPALLLALAAFDLSPAGSLDAVDRLGNDQVVIRANAFGLQIGLRTEVRRDLRDLFAEVGEKRLRERLLPLLRDPDRYAAAHLALISAGNWHQVNGRIYGGTAWLAPWFDDQFEQPEEWAGRFFFYGLEYTQGNPPGRFESVRTGEQTGRLSRYWRDYFAGRRTDFRYAPPQPGREDPRKDPADPPPVRPADDPLPSAAG